MNCPFLSCQNRLGRYLGQKIPITLTPTCPLRASSSKCGRRMRSWILKIGDARSSVFQKLIDHTNLLFSNGYLRSVFQCLTFVSITQICCCRQLDIWTSMCFKWSADFCESAFCCQLLLLKKKKSTRRPFQIIPSLGSLATGMTDNFPKSTKILVVPVNSF